MSSPISMIYRYSRPWSLLAGILMYALGGGIVNYLGGSINWVSYWIGQACVILFLVSSNFLKAYYDVDNFNKKDQRSQEVSNNKDTGSNTRVPRLTLLQAALAGLTVNYVLIALLYINGTKDFPILFFLSLAFLLSIIYAVPPFRLVYSGYGELIQAILITNLTPALAFLFQTGELHRLLAMLTFPLTGLFLAMTLAISLPDYASDIKYERITLMVRLGWRRGMILHNALIVTAYIVLVLAAILGLPWFLIWPCLLTLPLGLFQIWYIIQIAAGAKPRWRLLAVTAQAIPGLSAYLLALALWTG